MKFVIETFQKNKLPIWTHKYKFKTTNYLQKYKEN